MEPITIIKKAIEKLKLKDVCFYDMKQITPFFDYAIVATANSQRQMAGSINFILEEGQNHNLNFLGIEGKKDGYWTLIDFNEIVIHIFTKEERERFALDKLWKDLFLEKLPD